jgi:hypothetical protein
MIGATSQAGWSPNRQSRVALMACIVVLGGSVGACGPERRGGGAGSSVRDSAGVEIVENRAPRWTEGGGWKVGSEPTLRVGVVEGDEVYQFSQITGVVRLADGGVAVADMGSSQVRFFGPDGRHLATVGRAGGGPGEFTGLSALGRAGPERLWAYDFALRRVTWMNDKGEVTGITTLAPEPAMLNPVGAFPDGSFLLKQLWGAEATAGTSELGLRRDPIAFVRFDEAGTLLDTLGLFPGREVYITEEDGRGVMGTPPFARSNVAALRGDRLVIGSGNGYQVEELDEEGRHLRILRIPGREREVGSEEMESFIQTRLEGVPPEDRPRVRQSILGMPHPPTVPPYGSILADDDGDLWISEWAPYPRIPGRWDVFDGRGGWLGEVRTPSGFVPNVVGSDWILGVEMDDMDVEYVVVYPLLKD